MSCARIHQMLLAGDSNSHLWSEIPKLYMQACYLCYTDNKCYIDCMDPSTESRVTAKQWRIYHYAGPQRALKSWFNSQNKQAKIILITTVIITQAV